MIPSLSAARRVVLHAGLVAVGLATGAAAQQPRAPAPARRAAVVPLAPDTSWVSRATIYQVFTQDFTPEGTLRGVAANLDRIAATGATTIWLMPVQPPGQERKKGTLGSRYAIRDYRAVDPAYGTPADFQALVGAAHARGLKVILDWVPDHTAWDHPWVRQHPEYYVKDARGELSVPIDPDGKPTDWTDVVMLDYRNPAVRRETIDAMKHWLVTHGIDGFRVDVAGFVPSDFWREALPELRASVPRPILLLAEWGTLEMHRVGFDLSYGWDGYKRLKGVFVDGKPAAAFVAAELAEQRAMPKGGKRLRFTTNHDETAWDKPPITLFGGAAQARAAFVANAFLPGRPMLYNGQEVESPQVLGIFEKEAIRWDQPAAEEARRFYEQVMRLAAAKPAFISGRLESVRTSAPNDVIAYRRGEFLVLVNARGRTVVVDVPGVNLDGRSDMLSSRIVRGRSVLLPAYGTLVVAAWAR